MFFNSYFNFLVHLCIKQINVFVNSVLSFHSLEHYTYSYITGFSMKYKCSASML